MQPILEIACFSLEDALIAAESGADRIEFCNDYSCGGLTPPVDEVKKLIDSVQIPVFVMIQPRPGNYVYHPSEMYTIVEELEQMRNAGAAGLVAGAVTENGELDLMACRLIADAAQGLPLTFHRAFDTLKQPLNAMEELITLGFHRILCSGGPGNAIDNLTTLKQYVEAAGNRITILPGGGVRPNNILDILRSTGAQEIHSAGVIASADGFHIDEALVLEMKQKIETFS
jgi:copper homeostasis protein